LAVDFALESRRAGEQTVIAVRGDLDVLTAPRLRDRLIEVIDGGSADLLVDLSACEFIDSSGLSALVSALKRVRASGGDLGLVCPAGNVRRLIEVVALDQVFKIRSEGPPAG
jgi:anti-sigma B factor antagonist